MISHGLIDLFLDFLLDFFLLEVEFFAFFPHFDEFETFVDELEPPAEVAAGAGWAALTGVSGMDARRCIGMPGPGWNLSSISSPSASHQSMVIIEPLGRSIQIPYLLWGGLGVPCGSAFPLRKIGRAHV